MWTVSETLCYSIATDWIREIPSSWIFIILPEKMGGTPELIINHHLGFSAAAPRNALVMPLLAALKEALAFVVMQRCKAKGHWLPPRRFSDL